MHLMIGHRSPQVHCRLTRSRPWLLLAALSWVPAIAHGSPTTETWSPSPSPSDDASPPPCDSLPACLAAVVSHAEPGPALTSAERAIAQATRSWGARAVPGLVALLKHENPEVAELAAYVLHEIDSIHPKHLNALITAYGRGIDRVPIAIARVGTKRAIEFIAAEFRRRPSGDLQFAMVQLGTKSVPHLVAVYSCTRECSMELTHAANAVVAELGSKARSAVAPLIEIATDRTRPLDARRDAIHTLGSIGAAARPVARRLLRLATAEPENFEHAVDGALVKIGGPVAIDYLLAQLDQTPNILVLRDLARLGEEARAAGPRVMRYLGHDDPKIRLGAARTLGFIGYRPAVPALIHRLDDDTDWRMVAVCAESLGRLWATAALELLATVARTHWHPPVRDEAAKAIGLITIKSPYPNRFVLNSFSFEYFRYQHLGRQIPTCTSDHTRAAPAPRTGELSASLSHSLQYEVVRPSHDATTETRTYEPQVGIRTPGGWLVGANHGEWGGELVFVGNDGQQQLVATEEVAGITRLGGQVVVLVGLAHLTSNHGAVMIARRSPAGHWSAVPWLVLPGAPGGSAMQPDGRLLVHTLGGSVLISADGAMELVRCEERESAAWR